MILATPYRLSHCAVNRPIKFVDALKQCLVTDTQLISPICKWLGDAVVFLQEGGAAVANLLSTCRPATVFRRIRAIVVDPVDGMRKTRALSHVRKKCLEILPAVAYSDAPPAVPVKSFVVGVFTPCAHGQPDFVCWRIGHAMRAVCFLDPSEAQTAAGFGFSPAKIVTAHEAFITAVASAKPANSARDFAYGRNYSQKPKPVTRYIGRMIVQLDRCKMEISHCLVSFKALVRGLPVGAGSSRYSTTPHPINAQITGAST